MNTKPYRPTINELKGAPRAFIYELQMFLRYVQIFECFKSPCPILLNESLRNAILEAILLHTRNLLDFFIGKQPKQGKLDEDSIRAGYFVNKECWWQSDKLSYTKSRKNDINQSLSHITFKRIEGKYEWDLLKIKEEIEAAYNEFLLLLPVKDRVKWSQNQ